MGVYLPGQKNEEKIDVAIALDVSGSISSSMIEEFLGEVSRHHATVPRLSRFESGHLIPK